MASSVPNTASRESSEFEFVSSSDREAKAKEVPSNLKEEDEPSADGLFGWVKGSGGLFSKVAEKTKSSVESMMVVLDPQMKGTFKILEKCTSKCMSITIFRLHSFRRQSASFCSLEESRQAAGGEVCFSRNIWPSISMRNKCTAKERG